MHRSNKEKTLKMLHVKCNTGSGSLINMDAETLKPLIFGNKKTNRKSKIGFVRASRTSVPSVEVAQIPQNQTYLSSSSQHNLHQSTIPVCNKDVKNVEILLIMKSVISQFLREAWAGFLDHAEGCFR